MTMSTTRKDKVMEELMKSIAIVVEEEYKRASAQYGEKHHTQNEAYAVIREEFQETCECVDEVGTLVEERFWTNVRKNNLLANEQVAKNIYQVSILAACEAVQTAAMAYKAMQGYEKQEVKE